MSTATQNVKDWVLNEVMRSDVVIFSKTYCPYCTKAKSRLKELFTDIIIHELNTKNDGLSIQMVLPITTVPCIFIAGESIGGLAELNAMFPEKPKLHRKNDD